MDQQTVYDTATIITMLTGVFIPILVGVVTRLHASSGLKAVVNALLSAISGALTALLDTANINWRHVVVNILLTWIVSVATYYGLWKPTTTAQVVQLKTRNIGIGPSTDGSDLSAA